MKIDPESLMFTDLTDVESVELYRVAEGIVRGDIPHPRPEWMREWFRVSHTQASQELLMLSTVLPLRITLSILKKIGFGETCPA